MKKNYSKILSDIYALDPMLKDKETQIISLIDQLMRNKPETKLDKKFVAQLRKQLIPQIQPAHTLIFTSMQKFLYTLGGAVIILIIMVPVLIFTPMFKTQTGTGNKQITMLSKQVIELPQNAFGVLQTAEDLAARNGLEAQSIGIGGGGGNDSSTPTMAPTVESAVSSSDRMIMPAYIPTRNEYLYTGDTLTIDDAELYVYRRQIGTENATRFAQLVQSAPFDLIQLNSFPNMMAQNISMIEQTEDGYNVFISFDTEEVSINRNYGGKGMIVCITTPCEQPGQQPFTMPSTEELITIAQTFLLVHGVDTSSYAPAEIDANSFVEPATYAAEDLMKDSTTSSTQEPRFLNERINVLFPLLIENKFVYEQEGNKIGITLNVDAREKMVNSVWGLTGQRYERSLYATEQDVDKILSIAKNGGWQQGYWYEENMKMLQNELGTPERAFVQISKYENNKHTQYLVPALVFPITKRAELYSYPRAVVVPLAKDFFPENMPDTRPMPYDGGIEIMPAEGSTSSGSATQGGAIAPDAVVMPEPPMEMK